VGVVRHEPQEGSGKECQRDELRTLPLYAVSNRGRAIQPGAEHIVKTCSQTRQCKSQIFAMLPPPEVDEEMIEANVK
jgi:hypothetical protein